METLDALHLDTPFETVESLRVWPVSMLNLTRSQVFWAFTNDYNILEVSTRADEHKKDWVLIYEQKVKRYGSKKYTNQQLSDFDDKMPVSMAKAVHAQRSNDGEYMIKVRVKSIGAGDESSVMLEYRVYETSDSNKLYKTVLDTGVPETILSYIVRCHLGKKPTFSVSVGDDNNWHNWVQTNTLRVWEPKPGDQVDSSLVESDVLDQFTYVHQQRGGLMFLNSRHETL
ncbi:7914_t:CDS:2 [Ambispora gerdemannii]|uniref:7914_t:CDS:1 n=1 Tax=Ambispora gerdemannii TaxID=144530 RepID=A0A9N9DH89_9GLOM|nr:7914_t:CDS:2 [Ambispora gerdemannii]